MEDNYMTEEDVKLTTIAIEVATRERLAYIGRKRDKYDDIINKILDFYEEHHVNTRLWDFGRDEIEEAVVLEEDWYHTRIAKAPTIEPNKKKQTDPNQDGAGDN